MTILHPLGRKLQLQQLHCRVLRAKKVRLELQALPEPMGPKDKKVKSGPLELTEQLAEQGLLEEPELRDRRAK
jgi:hypothetical protein